MSFEYNFCNSCYSGGYLEYLLFCRFQRNFSKTFSCATYFQQDWHKKWQNSQQSKMFQGVKGTTRQLRTLWQLMRIKDVKQQRKNYDMLVFWMPLFQILQPAQLSDMFSATLLQAFLHVFQLESIV